MPQSLLAFLAMMIATIAAYNQMGAKMGTYQQMIHSEYELMANAVTIEQMEIIALATDYDDLEDLDGDVLSRSFTAGSRSVSFSLTIDVQFVDDDGSPSASETDQKEVSIAATNTLFATALVTHARIFSD